MSSHRHPLTVASVVAVALATVSLVLFAIFAGGDDPAPPETTAAAGTTVTTAAGSTTTSAGSTTSTTGESTTTATTEPEPPLHAWVDRRTVGMPWGDVVTGLLTFRGNPTNSWYGLGPVPESPRVLWRYPADGPMCSQSTDLGVTATWCGNGWTGQPVIWERPDGITEMIFGAYDRRLHFVDADTGLDTRASVATGDIIKGTPTIDPDGYPLVYFGSRDNRLRILAIDRGDPIELWNTVADLSVEGRWNDDWDASPRIVNDIMFEGSENGLFYIYKLNRDYDGQGLVTVNPVLLFKMETYNDALLEAIGPSYPAVSVENSAALFEGTVYFANSAGRVIGLDITDVENGNAPIVFDYWVGDDVDASIVIDEEGMLYVSAEYERYLLRAQELGQLVKLDPTKPNDPYLWGMFSLVDSPGKGGLWSTPALGDGVLYAVTHKGFLVVVDRATGEELWVDEVGFGSWSSPAVVDDRLILATNSGVLRSYDIGDPELPVLDWELKVGEANIEATPAVWKGTIYVGVRDGYMYAIGE
jgi:outer membrane protein assembly factor BamB